MNFEQQMDEALRIALYAIGTCPPRSRQFRMSLAWLNFLLQLERPQEASGARLTPKEAIGLSPS